MLPLSLLALPDVRSPACGRMGGRRAGVPCVSHGKLRGRGAVLCADAQGLGPRTGPRAGEEAPEEQGGDAEPVPGGRIEMHPSSIFTVYFFACNGGQFVKRSLSRKHRRTRCQSILCVSGSSCDGWGRARDKTRPLGRRPRRI